MRCKPLQGGLCRHAHATIDRCSEIIRIILGSQSELLGETTFARAQPFLLKKTQAAQLRRPSSDTPGGNLPLNLPYTAQ
jgi:hypothetical protein